MATISPDRTNSSAYIEVVLWETLTESDTATAISPQARSGANCSVQVTGTFGGATIVLQGSNDGGTTWATLQDVTGSDISLTAAGIVEFSSSALQVRPSTSGGTSSDVDVYLVMRG